MQDKWNPVYICYDTNLTRYLEKNGFKSVVYGLNSKTLKPFNGFIRNQEFNTCLQEWLAKKKG